MLREKSWQKLVFWNVKLVGAHRDGKPVAKRERHILVKMSFYQDKVFIMKNVRRALANKGYYIIDDLTATD